MNKRRLKIGFASLIGAVALGLTITAVSSNGLCLFFPLKNSKVSFSCNKSTYYSTSMTNFTSWKAIVDKFGQ